MAFFRILVRFSKFILVNLKLYFEFTRINYIFALQIKNTILDLQGKNKK